MTYDEAVDMVLKMKTLAGTMPTKEDYDKLAYLADVEDLAKALGVEKDMGRLRVRAYAVVNIAVLRELRRRSGLRVKIAEGGSWNNGLFHILDDYEQSELSST